jgi:demethylmenaquinone methyltransferase/2-methoxy-6-polyprenyl-1,4-benzoquinol methylase
MTPDRHDDAPERRLRQLDLERHLRNPEIRQRFVTTMFDVIAPRYDRFTALFSFGMDRGWKRELVDALRPALRSRAAVLDLACGTGDLVFAVRPCLTDGWILGLDISRRMIADAARRRRRLHVDRVAFSVGDMLHVPLPTASVDVVVIGYGVRNAPDHRRALDEVGRVLRPGGRLVTLDFYRPRNPLWRWLFLRYLLVAGNLVGWWWHRHPAVYGYIGRSIQYFVSWQDFRAALEARHFTVEDVRPKLGGGICLHVARKDGA